MYCSEPPPFSGHTEKLNAKLKKEVCPCQRKVKDPTIKSLKGSDFCERVGNLAIAGLTQTVLGEAYFEIDEYQESFDHYIEAIKILKHLKHLPSSINLNELGEIKAQVMLGRKNIELKKYYEKVLSCKVKVFDGTSRRIIGEILLYLDNGHISEAEYWIQEAIRFDNQNGMMMFYGEI